MSYLPDRTQVKEIPNELPMSKVMQLLAAIAPRGFALPKHLNLMSSNARNRARCAGLIFTDPDDAVTQREPTSHCGIHDDAPGLIDRRRSLGNGTAFSAVASSQQPVCDAHPSKIFGSGIPIMSPRPEYSDA